MPAPLPLPLSSDNTPSYVSELLYRLKVRDVMTRKLHTVARDATLRDAQNLMKSRAITGVPVSDGLRLLGIVSMDDIIRALEEGQLDTRVDTRMTRNVTVLEDDMPLAFALSYMEKYRYGRFPVLNRERELVGIITSRDIIVHLLVALNHEMEILEQKMREGSEESPLEGPENIQREYRTRRLDFENAGKPSADIKALCKEHHIDPKTIRRIAVASYELEMNQVIHSQGGIIQFLLKPGYAQVTARDSGPGIPDVEAALTEGWSTATEWIRSLGFGAGMGLPNTRRVSDEFSIESSPRGTVVVCGFRV